MDSPESFPPSRHDGGEDPWGGDSHPYASLKPRESVSNPAVSQDAAARPMVFDSPYSAPVSDRPQLPVPIQQAIEQDKPIRFSTPAENQGADNRQPDFFFTPEGKLVPNINAAPSPDGSINIEIQSHDQQNNQSLQAALSHASEMQKQSAREMIRYFQKSHPGKPVPPWMEDLANAKPNVPDFVPFNPRPGQTPTPPPENGFVPRGTGGGGSGGFAGNGGFDGGGQFRGTGGSGDGTVWTGGGDAKGAPVGPGEQAKAKDIYDYFIGKGFTPAQASGILGNIQTESSFKTNAYNAGEGAIGICQWEGPRRTALENFASQQGKPVTDLHVQLDFIMHEFTHGERGAYAAVKAAQTPEQAAQAFQSKYERSASLGNRAANAKNWYQQLA